MVQAWLVHIDQHSKGGRSYVQKLRLLAAESIAQSRRGSAFSSEVGSSISSKLKTIQKAVLRSEANGIKWYQILMKTMPQQVPGLNKQNSFTKWLGEAILTGDPSQMPEILRPSPGAVVARVVEM